MKNKSGKISLIVILIFIVVIILIGFWCFQKKKASNPDKNELAKKEAVLNPENSRKENSDPTLSITQNVFSGNREEFQKMIGEWDTGCLIADPKNKFAERHEFIFQENGTGRHFRLSGESCEKLVQEKTIQSYKIEIPEVGKINFIALDSNADNIFDIYKIQGGILYFGHGPRDWYPLSLRNFGGSLETRFDALNDFLKYKKK